MYFFTERTCHMIFITSLWVIFSSRSLPSTEFDHEVGWTGVHSREVIRNWLRRCFSFKKICFLWPKPLQGIFNAQVVSWRPEIFASLCKFSCSFWPWQLIFSTSNVTEVILLVREKVFGRNRRQSKWHWRINILFLHSMPNSAYCCTQRENELLHWGLS